MASHNLEVTLKGQFSYIDVFLEGQEIPLREIDNDVYYRQYSNFDISNPLDINVRLCGFPPSNWDLSINVDNKNVFHKNKPFAKKWVDFTESIMI